MDINSENTPKDILKTFKELNSDVFLFHIALMFHERADLSFGENRSKWQGKGAEDERLIKTILWL